MLLRNPEQNKAQILDLLAQPAPFKAGDFGPLVKHLLKKKAKILALARKHPTPFYALDSEELEHSLTSFRDTFQKHIPECEFFYAMKVNSHPWILKNVVAQGFGIDVSSGLELTLALKHNPQKIVYSGPGKTLAELELALEHADKVTVNIDSFGELRKLDQLTRKHQKTIRAGIRLYTQFHGSWSKFGIPLSDLKIFWNQAQQCPYVKLEGVQIHMSWNRDATPYQNILGALADTLKKDFTQSELSALKFIDFGGGFKPFQSEGIFPWKTTQGALAKIAADAHGTDPGFGEGPAMIDSVPLETYAQGIAQTIKEKLEPLGHFTYFTEPGRILCNNAMHLVTRVTDLKTPTMAIADAGINSVGWERFEHDYFPLINLTHPSEKEMEFKLFGPLCMPQDFLGYACHATSMEEGDAILIPYQGALTYSLAQNFIQPIPKSYVMRR